MDDVVKSYTDLRVKASTLATNVTQRLSISEDTQPAGFFCMAFNSITLTLELLDYYKTIWSRLQTTTAAGVELARKQNAERVILVSKMCFVEVLSALEYCIKGIALRDPGKFGDLKGRIYLSMLADKSEKLGFVSAADLVLWQGAIRLRNSLVHNNGVSEETNVYVYPGCRVDVQTNKPTQGDLRTFPNLTDWVVGSAESWIVRATS